MAKYTLLLRDATETVPNLSPTEMQAVVARYSAWADRLREAGKLAGSQKLRDGDGRVVRRNGTGVMVTDGPFTEGKEVMGGLFVVEVDTYDDALTIARDCPHLEFGSIEVRAVEILR